MIVDFIVCDDCGAMGGRAPFHDWRQGRGDVCPGCAKVREAKALEIELRAKAEEEADAVADKARADYLAAWEARRAAPPALAEVADAATLPAEG